ncbi:hypothetical protein KW807_01980 [Candidatus Parcubacteria bacterium]|nr:hypothetical protein [Candidatus Parcubacteria bacterium]
MRVGLMFPPTAKLHEDAPPPVVPGSQVKRALAELNLKSSLTFEIVMIQCENTKQGWKEILVCPTKFRKWEEAQPTLKFMEEKTVPLGLYGERVIKPYRNGKFRTMSEYINVLEGIYIFDEGDPSILEDEERE